MRREGRNVLGKFSIILQSVLNHLNIKKKKKEFLKKFLQFGFLGNIGGRGREGTTNKTNKQNPKQKTKRLPVFFTIL